MTRRNDSKRIALGGVFTAVAVVVMCLGGFIPVATYVCPMLCTLVQFLVFRLCGKRIGWAWFAAVAILSLLLGPDKEAAMVFLAVGYYPLIKPLLEKYRLSILWKLLFFNAAILVFYTVMISLLGMQELIAENMEFGIAGLVLLLVLGNLTFFLLDRLLNILARKIR